MFVSGLDPARVEREDIAGNPVFNGFHWALRHAVGRDRREVTARALGMIYGQAVIVVPSERLVIARFGTAYDLRQAMIDLCRLAAGVVASLRAPAGATR